MTDVWGDGLKRPGVQMGEWSASCHRLGCRAGLAAVLLIPVGMSLGCSQKVQPIFEPERHALVWPVGQGPPRVRYVGALKSSADLKAPRKGFRVLAELFFGAKEPQRMHGPRALVCTPDGRAVWIADPGGRCLHRFDLVDRSYQRIKQMGDTPLLSPVGLSLGPDGSLFVCDSEIVAVYRFSDRTGTLIDSLRLPSEVVRPVAVSYWEDTNEVLLVDVSAHNLKVLGLDGRLHRLIGHRGTGPGEFNFPSAVADAGDMIWVVDTGNWRVQGLSRDGTPITSLGQAGDAPGDLACPKGVAVDSEGNIYVVDSRYENVQIFHRSGSLLLFFGHEGTGPGEFWLPAGVFIDADDRIWVCDSYNGRVQVFDYVKLPEPQAEPTSEKGP